MNYQKQISWSLILGYLAVCIICLLVAYQIPVMGADLAVIETPEIREQIANDNLDAVGSSVEAVAKVTPTSSDFVVADVSILNKTFTKNEVKEMNDELYSKFNGAEKAQMTSGDRELYGNVLLHKILNEGLSSTVERDNLLELWNGCGGVTLTSLDWQTLVFVNC